jgi:rhodanese-related sulfurtransferase
LSPAALVTVRRGHDRGAMTETPVRPVGAVAGTAMPEPREAVAHFEARMRFETDVSDVAADLATGTPEFVLVDTRSADAWAQGHLPGAVHCPTVEIPRRGASLRGDARLVVVYCWGPGCNGATRAALAFARLGHPVKEMLGGFEYWAREGLPVEDGAGSSAARTADPLTTIVAGITCDC